MYEVRGVDIRTDTVQQTGSYEDIWRIHEAVMNLFGFFYRSARVSLMDKVGAGKHISVMARQCRKNKLNSLLTFHTLSTPFFLHLPQLLISCRCAFQSLSPASSRLSPSLSRHLSFCLASTSLSLSPHPFLRTPTPRLSTSCTRNEKQGPYAWGRPVESSLTEAVQGFPPFSAPPGTC